MRNSLKKCSSCGSEKPLSEFNKSKSTPDGLDYRCRDCAKAHSKRYREQHPEKAKETVRKSTIKKKFNLSIDEYEQLLEKQNYKCAICGCNYIRYKQQTNREFCIDDNHYTGEVRGLLCSVCNRAIGQLKDNPAILRKAADYLEERGNY